ncbi:MAG: site-2 protease family protein [Clostridiales bacterium]|nr:site-2 protease family protein [Clostridiales bacterium]
MTDILDILITILKILIAILVFGIIILVHELGHFFVAKLMGVKVNEFAIGMGPRLLKFGKKETVYSLRAFPVGGFCAMEGEDADSPDPRAFGQKKVWRRVLIVIAGAVMNLVLGYVLLTAYYGIYTQPRSADQPAMYSSTTIARLDEDKQSYQTGLRPGDQILKIDGKGVVTDFDITSIMQSDEDGVFDITVRREVDGKKQKVELKDVAFPLKTDEATGRRYLEYEFIVKGVNKTVLSTLAQAGKMEYSVGIMIWRSLGDILTGKYGLNDLSGPVGVVDAIGDAAMPSTPSGGFHVEWDTLLMMVVMITVNVGIFNLLPLPALDGGRLIFLIIEGIFRKPVPAKYEGWIHAAGLVLLLGLMVVVTFGDISRIITGG